MAGVPAGARARVTPGCAQMHWPTSQMRSPLQSLSDPHGPGACAQAAARVTNQAATKTTKEPEKEQAAPEVGASRERNDLMRQG
jgi:hypothetical protein